MLSEKKGTEFMKYSKKVIAFLAASILAVGTLAGCASDEKSESTSADGKKVFVFGDTTFNPENEEPDVNPHNAYSGWACIR